METPRNAKHAAALATIDFGRKAHYTEIWEHAVKMWPQFAGIKSPSTGFSDSANSDYAIVGCEIKAYGGGVYGPLENGETRESLTRGGSPTASVVNTSATATRGRGMRVVSPTVSPELSDLRKQVAEAERAQREQTRVALEAQETAKLKARLAELQAASDAAQAG